MSITENLDLSAGAYVKGVRLSDTCFVAATSFQQLRTITRDPDVLQPGSKRGNDDPAIEEERAMHELIQRALSGNKKSNVPKYTRYIEQLVRGEIPGVLPPMHLWSAAPLDVVVVGATTYALVPNGEHLLAIDGETQLTAHHALGRSITIDDKTRSQHRAFPLVGIVHHGISTRDARQYFHDLNILAVKPNASLGLSMDTQDPIMQVVTDVETNVALLAGRVEKMSRQLAKASNKIMTLQSLRQMVVNVAKGISGVQYGARPAPVNDVDLRELTAAATDWIGAYLETFHAEVVDREKSLASSGPVLAAVGAMGNELLHVGPEERSVAMHRMLDGLRRVDWTKGHHWVGIAGNYTPSGVFSVKGTKEVAYSVYNALTDIDNGGYHQVHIANARDQVPASNHGEGALAGDPQ
ncbi:DNA sulfur modification protein DndB [Cellulomonas sp. ATA003]|uniref:DNA sulfur modification protein DndB n=1 Tax=Cellulomonas sp. ATA003 TaxID=3073064 RepID=UPI00287318A6|nr:DNA sulfur modification protein DndB [Cellulomonas sp. ATA003]WNB86455.1 DNA sulfur modification protein DndB [Cellulomonas sp. ATA003]